VVPRSTFPLSRTHFTCHISAAHEYYPALLIAAILTSACHQSDAPDKAAAKPTPIEARVITTAVVEQTVHEQVVGTVQPALQATVSSKTTGRIIEMTAVPGGTVTKDQILARIETPQLEAALVRAEAALANAKSEAERYRGLRDSGSVSQRDIDRVETTLQVATAERDQIKSQLDEADIKAPFAGRITHKIRDTGDLVLPGTPVCRIEDPTGLRFEINLGETLANHIALKQKFRVLIESSGLDIEGSVAEISPAADTGSRTFLIKLDLPAGQALLAGQFGRAFLPRAKRTAIVVPQTAVLQRGQMTYAAVLDDQGTAQLRIIRTGAPQTDGIEVLAGLAAGERILAEVPADFAGGTPVTPAS
jgi:RND family efflux transporter MFP subunit